jgi:hypothetical protein
MVSNACLSVSERPSAWASRRSFTSVSTAQSLMGGPPVPLQHSFADCQPANLMGSLRFRGGEVKKAPTTTLYSGGASRKQPAGKEQRSSLRGKQGGGPLLPLPLQTPYRIPKPKQLAQAEVSPGATTGAPAATLGYIGRGVIQGMALIRRPRPVRLSGVHPGPTFRAASAASDARDKGFQLLGQ